MIINNLNLIETKYRGKLLLIILLNKKFQLI